LVFVKKQARGRGKGTDGQCHTAAEVNLELRGWRGGLEGYKWLMGLHPFFTFTHHIVGKKSEEV
jgi:hypothetical protein